MGVFRSVSDFALFKEFVTPAFLKILYLVVFIALNLAGLAAIAFVLATSLISALALLSNDATSAAMGLIVALIVAAIMVVVLLVYNLLLRMYFEIVLLVFNIHGYLKSIDDKTEKGKR